eukprot:1764616-Pyramimonas_sp.AAC.1
MLAGCSEEGEQNLAHWGSTCHGMATFSRADANEDWLERLACRTQRRGRRKHGTVGPKYKIEVGS